MSRAPVTPRGTTPEKFDLCCIKPIDTLSLGEAAEVETGPGQVFAPFLAMEDLLDKLKLLNYEKELVFKMRMRPINRQAAHHFFLQ